MREVETILLLSLVVALLDAKIRWDGSCFVVVGDKTVRGLAKIMKYNSSDVKCMVRPINCKQCDRPSVDDLYWDYRLLDGNRGGEFFTQWFVPVPVHFLKETGELCGPLRHDFEDTVRVDDHFIRDLVNTLRDGELLNLGACWRDKSGVFRIIYSRIPCSPDYSFSGVVIYATWWFKQPLGPHPYMVILAGKRFLQSLILTTILSVIRLH